MTRHKGVRQFVKFGIVGASSTVINFTVFNLLYYKLGALLVLALTAAFLVSVCNGFYWNRRWTFKDSRGKPAHTQSMQFALVNLIGWMLNTSIVVLIVAHFTSHGAGLFGNVDEVKNIVLSVLTGKAKQQYGFWLLNGALAAATCVVVFWNFFANRFWTFKH